MEYPSLKLFSMMLLPLLMAQKSGAHQLRLGSIYPIIYKEFDMPVGFQQSNIVQQY